ncbi:restriction endonuclease [Streptomyces olivaceoviridis]|uniref:restriction endonuclease n=1 Tax=Streptomyces olivaceoviridis TaxID=1921 RepID=UPI0033B19871
MTSTHHVLYEPQGRLTAELPPDRAVHEQVVRTALAWSSPLDVPADDVAAIGGLLAGAVRVVADAVRGCATRLPEDDGRRLFAEVILQEADGCLSQPCTSLSRVHNRARLIRALYERLDRLQGAAAPADEAAAGASP